MSRTSPVTESALSVMIKQYAVDLRRNASGGDDYPYEFAKGVADYLGVLIKRAKGNCACAQNGFPDSCDNCDAFGHAPCLDLEPVDFFSESVDAWGALEWFNRMAKAIREQDVAVLAGDEATMEMCRNVAASSAMRLVREFEPQVRVALTPSPDTSTDRVAQLDRASGPDEGRRDAGSNPVAVDLMQRVWANLYYNEEDAGNTFQQTLNEVVDWLAARNALPAAAVSSPNQHSLPGHEETLDALNSLTIRSASSPVENSK